MSPLSNTLLGIARQAKVWLTPAHQSYALIPTGSVPLWSEEFRDWILQKLGFETLFASVTYNRVLRQLDQEAKSARREETHLRTAPVKGGYQIDLGDSAIHLTGKGWTIKPNALAHDENRGISFHRPATSHPLPHPTHSTTSLPDHLRSAFALDEKPAHQLAQWLELALRPDTLCPPLILTGPLRNEAATAIRQLIDPETCAMFPLPTSRRDANWMALYHSVLAFQTYAPLTDFKKNILQALARGARLRLHQADHKGPKLEHVIHRPVILTAESAPKICGNQIEIEIKKCGTLPQQEVLAALFDQMVKSIRDEKSRPEEVPYVTTCDSLQLASAAAQSPFP